MFLQSSWDVYCVLLTGKSCMTILTMVKYEWFEEWKDTTVRKRGDEYHNYKMRFAKNLFEWACTLFPKIKNKVDVCAAWAGTLRWCQTAWNHFIDRFKAVEAQRLAFMRTTCLSVGLPGCGNPTDQHALPGFPTWSHVLCWTQPGAFLRRGCGTEQVQHPRQKPLHIRYETLIRLAELFCFFKLCNKRLSQYRRSLNPDSGTVCESVCLSVQVKTCSAVGLQALCTADSSAPLRFWVTSSTSTYSSSRRGWRGGKPERWLSWQRRSCSECSSLPLQDNSGTTSIWCKRTSELGGKEHTITEHHTSIKRILMPGSAQKPYAVCA